MSLRYSQPSPRRSRYLRTTSVAAIAGLALLASAPALADPAAAAPVADAPAPLDEIVVTGSQVARPGFVSPTPITNVDIADINRVGSISIADALNQLPALKPSVTPSSVGNLSKLAGGNYLDLRGLGYLRTLTLIDGKRYVPTTPEGVINTNLVPQALIASVDVVTGGASAAYGSDAVSGVVNLKLDNKLEGLKGSVQGGITDHNDNRNYRVSVGYGHSFAGGAGHFLVGAEISQNGGIADGNSRKWAGNKSLISNPANATNPSAPELIHVNDARAAYASEGGLIEDGVAAGTQFLTGGTTAPFKFGSSLTAGNTMDGGDGDPLASPYVLETPVKRWSTYAGANYDFTPSITGYANFIYAHSNVNERSIPSDDEFTIKSDNAYLPASIKTALAAAGQTSFTLGRGSEDYGVGRIVQNAHTWQGVAGLKGTIIDSWTFDASYAYGKTRTLTLFTGDVIKANRLLAIDAVVNPANGSIVCRSTLTNPTNGCVPLNLFGSGSPSQAAVNYITGTSVRDWHQKQQVGDLAIRGTPFNTWAGPVSFAIGGDWRRLDVDVLSDPISAAKNVTLFRVGNTKPYTAYENVKEGFVETVIPLAKDESWAKNIDVDLAGRITDYRNSGTVKTWKAGLNYAIDDSIRLRVTRSRDIRAPNINELFAAGQTLIGGVTDPKTGTIYNGVSETTGGNPFLKPEKADTLTAGVVFTPTFLHGLDISIDYYDIKVKGAIASLTAQTIVARCASGDSASCLLVTRNGSGAITGILLAPVNFQTMTTNGIDVEIAYHMRAFGGTLGWHGLVSYLNKLDLVGNGSTTKFAGNTDQPVLDGPGGTPHWKANASVTYTNDTFTASLTGRYVGGGVITRDDVTLDDNYVKGRVYFDISAEVPIWKSAHGGKVALFGVIQNMFDKDPPFTGYEFQTARQLYDVIGRQYTAGVRFSF